MSKLKIIIAGVGIILAMIIVLQNTESVETRLLFITLTMPRAALLGMTFFLGLLVGLGLSLGSFGKKAKPEAAE